MRTLTGQHYIVNCTGRKPEKGDVHVYVYVNHGAAHQKQTNKPCNIVSHLYTDTKYKLHKENADSSPWALVTGAAVTSPKPGQAWFPRMDWCGADGLGRMCQPMSPALWTCCACFPLHRPTTSRSRWVLLQPNYGCCTQRMVEPLGWKSFEKSPGLHVSWWWGSHLQPPSLGLPHLRMKAPLCRVALPELGFDQGIKGKEGFPGGSDGRESACNAGDSGSMPESGRSLSEGNGYPLQYSCLENSMDRGAQQATVHGVAKSWKWLSNWH